MVSVIEYSRLVEIVAINIIPASNIKRRNHIAPIFDWQKITEYLYNETISKLDKCVSNYDTIVCHDCSISQEICTRFLLCCALLWLYIDWFSHIHQAYFTGTVAI